MEMVRVKCCVTKYAKQFIFDDKEKKTNEQNKVKDHYQILFIITLS